MGVNQRRRACAVDTGASSAPRTGNFSAGPSVERHGGQALMLLGVPDAELPDIVFARARDAAFLRDHARRETADGDAVVAVSDAHGRLTQLSVADAKLALAGCDPSNRDCGRGRWHGYGTCPCGVA